MARSCLRHHAPATAPASSAPAPAAATIPRPVPAQQDAQSVDRVCLRTMLGTLLTLHLWRAGDKTRRQQTGLFQCLAKAGCTCPGLSLSVAITIFAAGSSSPDCRYDALIALWVCSTMSGRQSGRAARGALLSQRLASHQTRMCTREAQVLPEHVYRHTSAVPQVAVLGVAVWRRQRALLHPLRRPVRHRHHILIPRLFQGQLVHLRKDQSCFEFAATQV